MTRYRASVLAAAAALVLAARPSSAQESTPPPPSPRGFGLQQLNPAPAGDRFVAVPDGRVRGLFEIYGRALLSYGFQPLGSAREQSGYIDHQLYAHFDFGLALAEALLLRADVPIAVVQYGERRFEPDAGSGELGDARLTLRINWIESVTKSLAVGTQVDLFMPTGAEGAVAGDGRVRANPMMNVSGFGEHFAYAASFGYLFRDARRDGGGRVGGAFTFGAGVALLFADDSVQVGPEIYGHTVTSRAFLASRSSPVEALLSTKLRANDVLVGLGVGTGFTDAPGTVDLRAVASIAYVPDERVLDADGDGLDDEHDACPTDPGFEANGCPPPDADGDTIGDPEDACPTEQGLVHADPSKHGCPPEPAGTLPAPTRY